MPLAGKRFRWREKEQTERCEKWPSGRFECSGVCYDEGGALLGSGKARPYLIQFIKIFFYILEGMIYEMRKLWQE